jgi:hypothetical protein
MQIGDATIADGILDRLVHNAYRIELRGESIRKKRNPPRDDKDDKKSVQRPAKFRRRPFAHLCAKTNPGEISAADTGHRYAGGPGVGTNEGLGTMLGEVAVGVSLAIRGITQVSGQPPHAPTQGEAKALHLRKDCRRAPQLHRILSLATSHLKLARGHTL